jgi:predicted esterase
VPLADVPEHEAMASSPRLQLIETPVHGRSLVRRGRGQPPLPLLVGFHGYGENAEAHLAEIEGIPEIDSWTVVAVQALHPFYSSRSGDIVASWMTRLDREAAIADNIRYVSKAVELEISHSGEPPCLVYIGFSQGTAMAYRAAAGSGHRCRGVVALGGDVPPELANQELGSALSVLIGRGERDEWYTEEKLARDLELLGSREVSCQVFRFRGGHEWTDAFRNRVGTFLRGLRQP